MSGITLSGLTLKPLLISVTQNLPEEIVNSPFGCIFEWYKTASGYLNEDAMKYYLEKNLIPYFNFIKKDLNQEDKGKFSLNLKLEIL